MLDMKELNEAIAELENARNHTPKMCASLADLYALRDHAQQNNHYERQYSQAAEPRQDPLDTYGDSEFLLVVSGKNPAAAWAVVDDLMDNLRVVNPRVYDGVMRKLKAL